MRAFRLGDPALLPGTLEIDLPTPQPKKGEVLVKVHAAGVTPTELQWYPTTHTKSGEPRTRAIPGHEFSGVIAAIGAGVNEFSVGQPVFGLNDWFADGATAEFCITLPGSIAAKPDRISHAEAATVPIGALTMWQAFERTKLHAGDRVLIHGGAGAVGILAVQFAARRGATLITTASSRHRDLLTQLGATEILDYRGDDFTKIEPVDIVLDCVGGETLRRSWDVLKPRGRLATIAADSEGPADDRTKAAFFIVEPNRSQLTEVAIWLEKGGLKPFVGAIVPLSRAADAYANRVERKTGCGKFVIDPAG